MDEAVEAADTAAALQLLATARRGLTQNAPPGDASLGVAIDGQRFVEQGTDGRDAPRDLGSPGGPGTEVVEGGPLPPGIKDKGVWDNGRATSTDLREAPGTLEAHSDSPNGEPDAIGRRGGICPTGAAQGRSGSSHGEERERISGRLPKAGREVDGFDGFGGQEAVVQTAGFGLSAELGCHVSDQRGDTCTEIEVCTIAHAQVTERLSGEASDCTHKVDPQKVGSVEVTDMTLVHQKQAAKRSGTPKGQHTQTAALVAVNSRTEIYERVGRNPSAIPVDCQAPAPLFVARFAAGWVYSVVATVGVSILEKEKRYSEAVTVLRQLLSGNHSRGRRGQWWGRLSINLDHLGRSDSLQKKLKFAKLH